MPAFTHRFRVRFSEVDPQAIAFNARYLDYADLAITELWRAAGIPFGGPDAIDLQVVRALVEYRKPLRVDELVDAVVSVARIGTSSITTHIALHGASGDDLRATIEIVHVHVDVAQGRSKPVPDGVRKALAHYSIERL